MTTIVRLSLLGTAVALCVGYIAYMQWDGVGDNRLDKERSTLTYLMVDFSKIVKLAKSKDGVTEFRRQQNGYVFAYIQCRDGHDVLVASPSHADNRAMVSYLTLMDSVGGYWRRRGVVFADIESELKNPGAFPPKGWNSN